MTLGHGFIRLYRRDPRLYVSRLAVLSNLVDGAPDRVGAREPRNFTQAAPQHRTPLGLTKRNWVPQHPPFLWRPDPTSTDQLQTTSYQTTNYQVPTTKSQLLTPNYPAARLRRSCFALVETAAVN